MKHKKYIGEYLDVFKNCLDQWTPSLPPDQHLERWRQRLYETNTYLGMLSHISSNLKNKSILDLGTWRGGSAFMLGENKQNIVHSYDITNHKLPFVKSYINRNYPNITFNIKSCLDIPSEELKSVSLIYLDLAPHDGIKEEQMINNIRQSGFEGLLMCDDVCINKEMYDWWNSIEEEKEYGIDDMSETAFGDRIGFAFFSEESKNLLR
jgi:hypothetical protein